MAETKFREKSQKDILAMSKEEQNQYWSDLKKHYNEQKKAIEKKQKEQARIQNEKNKKKLNHARFVLFGSLIKMAETKSLLAKIDTSQFSETDKNDCNLLMKSLGWDLQF